MAQQKSPQRLAKLLDYILARRPDEFGLVTDKDGFIKIKELLKALTEEEGLKYVRRSHLDEILITLPNPCFEIVDSAIRAKYRQHLPNHTYAEDLPKLLYCSVRWKAYPHVTDKGIRPTGFSQVILSSSRDMAQRLGRRIDRSAVLLTVQVQHCLDQGVVFFNAGEVLFLADYIPPGCFSGPPLPKEKPAAKKADGQQKPDQKKPAGSFFIDVKEKVDTRIPKSIRKSNVADRPKNGKRTKKHKRRREPPPWRR